MCPCVCHEHTQYWRRGLVNFHASLYKTVTRTLNFLQIRRRGGWPRSGIFDWAEDRRQRLMICGEREASTVQICVKLSEAPHNTKGFLNCQSGCNSALRCSACEQQRRWAALYRQAWSEKEQRPGRRARHHLPHEAVDPGGNASTPSQIRFDVSLRRKQQCKHQSSAKRCCATAIG